MFFKQIRHQGKNFSYIIADDAIKEAAVIDPSFDVNPIIQILRNQSLQVKYVINSHHHRDHTAGNEELRARFSARVIAHKASIAEKDISVADGDIIKISDIVIKVIHTPGHTPDSICLLVNDKLLTGDTLFIGECGRTDLPGGSAIDMFHSLFHKLMKLDEHIEIYPGHDYGLTPHSTIGVEKKTNYTLKKRTLEEFIEFMKEP